MPGRCSDLPTASAGLLHGLTSMTSSFVAPIGPHIWHISARYCTPYTRQVSQQIPQKSLEKQDRIPGAEVLGILGRSGDPMASLSFRSDVLTHDQATIMLLLGLRGVLQQINPAFCNNKQPPFRLPQERPTDTTSVDTSDGTSLRPPTADSVQPIGPAQSGFRPPLRRAHRRF